MVFRILVRLRSWPLLLLVLCAQSSCRRTDIVAPADPVADASRDPESAASTAARIIDFNHDVRPIFNRHCISCHGGVKQASSLSFIRRATALAEAESGEIPIVPYHPERSFLIQRVSADEEERMPPADHGRALEAAEIETLRLWIEQGANWQEHWAYVPPVRQQVPSVRDEGWCLQPLDRFVLAKLEGEGIAHAAEADRRTWLRRVTFDLIGLPPTATELDAFLADDSPQAYERVVDRLLASSAYGERWAAMWLDLARYADTMGFERDPPRNVWPYRDWLIRAFNDDMPFDQFTIKQLAGDLLEDATLDDLIATTFHRNTQTNTEGGSDDEEFRVQAVIDRVNTTWQVWQGTTFGCTQCHAHPYAPFDNEEYYEFMAFFNNTRDTDIDEEYPLLNVPLDHQKCGEARTYDVRIRDLRRAQHQQLMTAAEDSAQWRILPIDKAKSTGSAKLRIRKMNNQVEVWTEGTISSRPTYTIESPLPENTKRLTALQIEVLPKDLDAALRTPEEGFILSHLRAFIVSKGAEKPHEIKFALAFTDEAEPVLDPEQSLDKNGLGWGAYSRLAEPMRAIFVLAEEIEVSPTDRLQLSILQSQQTVGLWALAIRRARYSFSDDPRWQHLIADEAFQKDRRQIAELRRQRQEIPHVSIPIMQEIQPQYSRHTYQFERGNWLAKTEEVCASTPSLFASLPEGAPRDRLAMARWLVSRENPLAARVMVNRLWTELFGLGLVETAEDFGSSGTPPSNQALLDHLAVRFQDDLGWNIKQLLREIVLSATYRQDSKCSKELRQRDPTNRLLARGPRNRLTAEMVRDQALMVSGLLSQKMYGPSVMPPQPDGVWRTVYNGGKWETAKGEDRYRRGLYTYWKRTSGYPSFMSFDMPSREVCTARRIVTNTPLQALTVMNDEAFIECAQALGNRMQQEVGPDIRKEIKSAFLRVTCHEAPADTVDDLAALYAETLAIYEKDAAQSEKLGKSPEQAARAVVANAILNLDTALTK